VYSFILTKPSSVLINRLNSPFKSKTGAIGFLRNKSWNTTLNIVKILGKTRAMENKSNYTYNSKAKSFQFVSNVGVK
jgi:hypothetical protein